MKSTALLSSALLGLANAQDLSGWKTDPAVTSGKAVTEIPDLGFGTWNIAETDAGVDSVANAIKLGYRSIDAATAYRNQPWVGKGIAKALAADPSLTRDQLFITSKIWSTRHPTAGWNETFAGLDANLKQLNLAYLDLALVHFPVGTDAVGTTSTAKNDIAEMWQAMEALLEKKNNITGVNYVRKIGISNYNVTQIEQLLAVAKVKPYVHQIELHPYLQQNDFIEFHKKHNIKLVSYAPLGNTNPAYAYRAKMTKPLLKDEVLGRIAKKRGCASNAQVAIAWSLKRGIATIPKAQQLAHAQENYKTVSQCKLTDADMATIKRLDVKARFWDMCCALGQPCYLGLDGQLDEAPVAEDYCAIAAGVSRTSNAGLFAVQKNVTGFGTFQLPVAFQADTVGVLKRF